jgi:hypothetical protein
MEEGMSQGEAMVQLMMSPPKSIDEIAQVVGLEG